MRIRGVLVCLLAALLAPLSFAQTQILGASVIQGGPVVTNNPAGSDTQVQIKTGSAFGAVPVTIDGSGNAMFGTNGAGNVTGALGTYNRVFLIGDSPTKNATSGISDFGYYSCPNEFNNGWSSAQGATGWTGTKHVCTNAYYNFLAPGLDLGTTMGTSGQHGPGGWSTQSGLQLTGSVNSPGISEIFTGTQVKAGIGDNTGFYVYNSNKLGDVAGSDEGNHLGALGGGEYNGVYAGTVAAGGGGTGATTLKVSCTADCAYPGDGLFLLDGSASSSNKATAFTNFSNGVASYTVATPVTVSTGWYTLAADVKTPVNNDGKPIGAGYTSMTFTLNSATLYGVANTGSPTVGADICFAGSYWEHSKIANVSGTGPWSVTVLLRHAHISGSVAMQGGLCGKFLDFTANDTVSGPTTFRYPFPVMGAVTSTTMVVAWPASQVPTFATVASAVKFADPSNSATYSGGVITFTNFVASIRPYMVNLPSITLSNATDATFNGVCTSTTVDSTGKVSCTPSGYTPGSGSTTGITISVSGTNQYGNTDFVTKCGAEVLDVLDYTTNPPSISPGNVTTLTLEPNNCSWPDSGAVEQPHHYAGKVNTLHSFENWFSPYMVANSVFDASVIGYPHAYVQNSTSGAYFWRMATQPVSNSIYAYHGGQFNPLGGIWMEGLFSSGLTMQYAPDGPGSNVILINCPLSGCTDPYFNYNLWTLTGNGGNATLSYVPNTNVLTLTSPGGFLFSTGTNNVTIPRLSVTTALTLPNNGVTAGSCTFCSLTLGADGRVTAQSSNSSTAPLVTGSVGAANVSSGGLSNLVRNTATMSGGTWSTTTMTATAAQTDPYGGANAVSIQSSAVNSAYQDVGFTLTSGTTYTACGWVKGAAGGEGVQVLIGGNGTTLSTIRAITTGWQFYTVSTAPTGSLTRTLGFFSTTATNQTVYLYGWGLSVGSSCTPWLPTTSIAVTTPIYEISAPALSLFSQQSTVNCATSGTATFSEPLTGPSDKKVMVHLAACNGAATYTFPTAFINTPGIFASSTAASGLVTSLSTTAATITGSTSTGTIILEDY